MIVAAVLVAAGSGSRLGSELPKAFVTVGGRTLLEIAASAFTAHPRVRDLVIAAPAALASSAAQLVPEAAVVPGGVTRQESVSRALAAVVPDADVVLVHDVARPFVPPAVIDRVLDALADGDAVVPVVPVADTIRRAGVGRLVGEVVDREALVAVQTPQGFRRAVLERAHAAAAAGAATDDAALVQALGVDVIGVPGDARSFKITVAADLARAEAAAPHD